MKSRTMMIVGRDRGSAFISQLCLNLRSEKRDEQKSGSSQKPWRATSIVCILFLILCASSFAAEPKTIAFLEEQNVAPGTPHTVGALYVVPPGRKAFVSNMFCQIRSLNNPGHSQILLVVFADRTIAGPATNTAGMNPLDCVNSGYITTQTSSAGFMLLPGNWLYALYANFGHSTDFQMLSAFIFEDDLNAVKQPR